MHGLEPGVDIAVTGYDDIEEAAISAPPLTTVSDGHLEIGRQAAHALFTRIGGETEPGSNVLIAPELRVRQSVNKLK